MQELKSKCREFLKMASVESLSDGEIRLKLAELGYPVGPITATTRKVLAKKLKLLLDQSKVPGDKQDSKSRVSLASFSSGEDSEDDAKVNSRKSMPPPPPKPANKRRSVSRSKELVGNNNSLADITVNSDLYPSASSTLKNKESPPKFKKGQSPNHNSNYNSVTNSSPDRDLSRRSLRKSYSPANSYRISKSYNSEIVNTDPFDTGSDSDIGSDRRSSNINHNKSPDIGSTYSPLTDLGFTQNFRSRFQSVASTSSYESPLTYSSSNPSPGIGNNDGSPLFKSSQPYSSDFVRKLSATSYSRNGSGLSSGLTSKLLDVKESDDEDVPAAYSYSQIKSRLRRDDASRTDSGRMWKNTTAVSMGLLLFLVLFFGGLTVIYLNVTYKEAPIGQTDTNLPICRTNGKVGVECILDAEMQPAMTLFRELFNDLQNHAISVKCSGETDKPTALSDNQLIQLIVEKKEGMNVWDVEKQLRNVKILIKANPKWGIEVSENGLDMPFPDLPITCSIINMAYMILGYGARLVLAILVIYGGQKGVRWWLNRQEQNKKEVFRLVENIIELLSNHQQAGNGDNFLAINHVRDQLIPPHQRQQMASIWNQAVAYLEENDSRVRVEIQQVAGEEFHVWHWLPSPRSNGRRKVWQGQAFETMEGSVNSLPISPTPCLKIRHMFEPDVEVGEDWVTRVQDAILEKCEGVKVLHVAVDKNSQEGCVYVKCSSPEEAGRAYRALHGSWFDSKLVTVKYLHLKRYHERFPEAAQAMGPLRPSNDQKLSLQ